MAIKSVIEIRNDMLQNYAVQVPTLDLTEGSFERDVFIEAPIAGSLTFIWQQVGELELGINPFENAEELSADFIDSFAANYEITRREDTIAVGEIVFFADAFTIQITIRLGETIQTNDDNPIIYETIESKVFSTENASSFFNSENNRYEFPVQIASLEPGAGTGVGSGSLTILNGSITGITGVTNIDSIEDGLESETNAEVMDKVSLQFIGRTISTGPGLETFLFGFFNDFRVLSFGDKGFIRNNFPGGKDIYFPTSEATSFSQTIVVPTADFTSGFILEKQPVIAIQTVIGSESGSILNFELTKDKGILKNSTKAKDGIVFTEGGVNDTSVTITYTYNSFLENVQTQINDPQNAPHGQDMLIREATQVIVDIEVPVTLDEGITLLVVTPTISTNLSQVINDLRMGADLERIDIIPQTRVSGVANVDTASIKITITGGGLINSQGDVIIDGLEYAVAGVITVIESPEIT